MAWRLPDMSQIYCHPGVGHSANLTVERQEADLAHHAILIRRHRASCEYRPSNKKSLSAESRTGAGDNAARMWRPITDIDAPGHRHAVD